MVFLSVLLNKLIQRLFEIDFDTVLDEPEVAFPICVTTRLIKLEKMIVDIKNRKGIPIKNRIAFNDDDKVFLDMREESLDILDFTIPIISDMMKSPSPTTVKIDMILSILESKIIRLKIVDDVSSLNPGRAAEPISILKHSSI